MKVCCRTGYLTQDSRLTSQVPYPLRYAAGCYPFENHFLIRLCRRLPVTRFMIFLYQSRGYQADDLRLSLNFICFSHIHFCRNIFAHQDSAIHVYTHTCACPDKAAQMYFSHVSPKPVLGMMNFCKLYKL